MSEENVEIVRRAFEVFNRYHAAKARGDSAEVAVAWEAATELLSPDHEYREDPKWPGAGTYQGLEECRQVWEGYYEQLGQQVFEPEEFLESGDQVVVILRWSAHGTSSGAPLEMRQGFVHTVRDGRIVKWEVYFDVNEALEAAGLSE
jgi:ketosteroid isomerase-like protein